MFPVKQNLRGLCATRRQLSSVIVDKMHKTRSVQVCSFFTRANRDVYLVIHVSSFTKWCILSFKGGMGGIPSILHVPPSQKQFFFSPKAHYFCEYFKIFSHTICVWGIERYSHMKICVKAGCEFQRNITPN